MEYTKGDWKWEWEQGQPTVRKKEGLDLIATVYPKIGKRPLAPINEAQANAHLISASPDLYEACKSAYAWYYEGQTGDYKAIGERLRKALSKAEGGK